MWYFHRFLWTHSEQFYPHSYVFLLRTVCVSVDAQVSVVEEIPHPGSTGMSSLLSALLHVNVRMGWGKATAIAAFLEVSGFATGDRDARFSLKRAY